MLSAALISYLAPGIGVFTRVPEQRSLLVMGQFKHMPGSENAHLTFLTPGSALKQPSALALIDHIVQASGKHGAWRLLADVDEDSLAFEALRRSGFSIHARQRVWQFKETPQQAEHASDWRVASSQDLIPIRGLYNNLAPALVQQMEPCSQGRPRGIVHYQKGELKAYADFKFGLRGVWVQPFIHPDIEDLRTIFTGLLDKIPDRPSRPIYICVRSYQAWLEPALEELGASARSRQVVMVKQMAQALPKTNRNFAMPTLDSGKPEVSTPIARSEKS